MTKGKFPVSECVPLESKSLSKARFVLNHLDRPSVDSLLDQCPATIESVLRRVELVSKVSPKVQQERLLLLGDDDLLSIALSATGFEQVTVLDADARLLRVISEATSKSVQIFQADLRLGLPRHLVSSFDIVFADPPYTLAGQLLFASCALHSLSKTGPARMFLCGSRLYLDVNAQTTIESYLRGAGFLVEERLENFNEYLAPADVQRDLSNAGYEETDTLFSDLSCFKRVITQSIPPIPMDLIKDIYAYGENYGTA
jgi:predicted methyltransferase